MTTSRGGQGRTSLSSRSRCAAASGVTPSRRVGGRWSPAAAVHRRSHGIESLGGPVGSDPGCQPLKSPFSLVFSEKKTRIKLGTWSISAWAATPAFPCSITPTTASCSSPSTCSRCWPCSSPTSPRTLKSASSVRRTVRTLGTVRKTVFRDALM